MSHKNDNACTFFYNQGENHVDHRDVVLGVLGVSRHPQIMEDQQHYLNQGADHAHQTTTGTPGFSDLPTALDHNW